MRVKNITDGPRDVPLLDTVVEAGEVVDVPEVQPDGSPITWPEATWQPVQDSPAQNSPVQDSKAAPGGAEADG